MTSTGAVKCWGGNFWGELGNGTTTPSSLPVDVSGLSGGIVAVSAGEEFTCVLTSAGGVKCWGDNGRGQLGDGTTTSSSVPVDVIGLSSGVAAISAGRLQTCALLLSGGMKCWGGNDDGELGDGSFSSSSTIPVDVTGLTSGVAGISAGSGETCAVTSAGGAKCWGANFRGQLGDGTTFERRTPVDVSGLTSGVAAVSVGGHGNACAVTTTGAAKCWGFNDAGQVGDGTTIDRYTPVDVTGLGSGVSSISMGVYHTCALTTSGGVKCWGSNSGSLLGDGTSIDHLTPVDVSGLTSGVTAVSAAFVHSCALTSTGGVKCWGQNAFGQLGDGTTTAGPTPVDVLFELPDADLALTGVPADIVVDATGPTGTVVTYTPPTAVDEDLPAPVVVCDHPSGSLFPIGTTTVQCSASDAEDENSPVGASFLVTVRDNDLALTGVPASITVDATGISGAVVAYTPPTAVDEDLPAPVVVCDHAPGSLFPIGTTTVQCSASESGDANSPVTAGFTVTVRGAQSQLQDLLAYVGTLPPGTSLATKVQAAITYLAAGDVRTACQTLTAVINEARAQSGKRITAGQADTVTRAATRIRSVLGC